MMNGGGKAENDSRLTQRPDIAKLCNLYCKARARSNGSSRAMDLAEIEDKYGSNRPTRPGRTRKEITIPQLLRR